MDTITTCCLEILEKGLLLSIDQNFPDSVHRIHAGSVFLSSPFRRGFTCSVNRFLEPGVYQDCQKADNPQQSEHDSRSEKNQHQAECQRNGRIAVDGQHLDSHSPQISTPGHGLEHALAIS